MALSREQLDLLDRTREVHVETNGRRGPIRTIIWIVVADDEVYVRSVRGESGRWYERARADGEAKILVHDEAIAFTAVRVEDPEIVQLVTDALRAKYPPGGSLDRMTRDEVLDTTLRLEPRD